MKKNLIIKAFVFGLLSLSIAACGTSNDVVSGGLFQKRKHTSGFYHNGSGKNQKVSNDEQAVRATEKEVEIAEEHTFTTSETPAVSTDNAQVTTRTEVNSTPEARQEVTAPVTTGRASKTAEQTHFVRTRTAVTAEKHADRKVTRSEQKSIKKSVKQVIKHATSTGGDDAILYVILCIFIPFVAVGLATDWNVRDVVINILLCCLCGIPGIIHAFIVCNREGVI